MSKDIDLYRSNVPAENDEYSQYIRNLEFNEQREAFRQRYWEGRGKHQTEMMRLANGFEETRQQLEATREYGPKLRALEYKKRIADVRLELEAKRAMIREVTGKKKPAKGGVILQALLARREQLAAEGLDTTELDRAIEELQ